MAVKCLDSDTLKRINDQSIEQDRNRTINKDTVYDRLDPQGIHIVGFCFPHGPDTDPHVRSEVFMKFEGQDEPQRAWLDLDWETYTSLRDVQEVQ